VKLKPNPCTVYMQRSVSCITKNPTIKAVFDIDGVIVERRDYMGCGKADAAFMARRYARERLGATSASVTWWS